MTNSYITAQPLLNGSPLPDFKLLNSQERPLSLGDVCGSNGVVVAFIHATWCPYCLRQLKRLNTLAARLDGRGVGLVCISADSPAVLYGYEQSVHPPLRYPLLADSEPSLAHAYGVYDDHPDHESPYPAVFFAASDNRVAYSDVSGDPDCFPNMERLMEVIEQAVSSPE